MAARSNANARRSGERRRDARTRNSQEAKAFVRHTAAVLFAKNGYHATGVEELSRAIGLGRGALYYYIGSKEQLLADISTLYGWQIVEFGEALLRKDAPAAERLRELSRELMRTLVAHLPEWTVFHRDGLLVKGRVRDEIVACRDRFEGIWRELLHQGTKTNEFRAIDPVAIKGLLGMFNYSYLWMKPSGRLTPDEVADIFCDTILAGLTQPRRTRPARRKHVGAQ